MYWWFKTDTRDHREGRETALEWALHFFTDKTCSTGPPQRKVKHGGFKGQREARLSPI